MKKLISVILSMAMVLCMTVTGFAEGETYSIKINEPKEGHTYQVYQIFTGDVSGKTLSNVKWGNGVTEAGKSALETKYTVSGADKVAEKLGKASNAQELAKFLVDNSYLTNPSTLTKNGDSYVANVASGYYLIKDTDGSLTGKDDAYTSYMVQVVGNVDMKPKSDVPIVVKKVDDINDSNNTQNDVVWEDSADYDIGDMVPFKLEATLPDNVSSYTSYKVEFHDTLSKGLKYIADESEDPIDNKMTIMIDGVDKTDSFTVTPTVKSDGTTELTISCNDVKAIGANNNSKITVTYEAKLDTDAEIGSPGNPNTVYLEYSNNPNQSGEGTPETGKTPEDKVVVFTYKTIIDKVNSHKEALKGAEFTLQKKLADGTPKDIAVVTSEEGTRFTFSGLDDGEYILTETKTPKGYNTIDPIEFKIVASHDNESADPKLQDLNGNKITGEISFTKNIEEGSLSAQVVNKTGAELPETGGIGTKIFYVVGAALVIGAGVLLITRKRMSTR